MDWESRAPDRKVAALAGRQHGVVARPQLLQTGLSAVSIDRRIRAGHLYVVHRGVYAVGHRSLTQAARWMAAVLAAGDLGLLSHRSAGALWRIVPVIQGPVHVTSAVGGRRQGGIIFHRTRSLGARERSERYSIPVTSPARTLLDVAGVLAPRQFERAFHEADRLGLLNVPDLQHLCDQATGRRGLQRLRSLVAEYCPAPETRSVLEYRFIQFCRTYGLPPPAVNVPVCGFEVDFYWPARKLVVELDGYDSHRTRLRFERDRERDATLQAAGIRVVRLTDRRMGRDPAGVASILLSLLSSSRRA